MGCFKRAEWHSGLTYKQTCRDCGNVMIYTDEILDFRPWYADGFVYCSKCHTPLRHNEIYAINRPVDPQTQAAPAQENAASVGTAKFCSNCGKPFRDSDRFCSECGNKRT